MEMLNQVRRAKFGTASVDLKLGHLTTSQIKGELAIKY
jgi:hypothetical protein